MAFAGGVFSRLFSWVNEAQGGNPISPVKFDQDMNDMAAGLSLAILRDGTGKPTTDVTWNDKRITNLGAATDTGDALALGLLTSTEVQRALGYSPVQRGTGPGQNPANVVAIGWNVPNGLLAALDGVSLGKVWTDNNIAAGDVTGKLGYVPARPSGVFNAAAGNISDILASSSGPTLAALCNFTATASSVLVEGYGSAKNTTSGSGTVTAYLGVSLTDNTNGAQIALANEAPASATFGQGLAHSRAALFYTGLVIGRSYQARLYAYKDRNDATCSITGPIIQGLQA